jgi:hypothetical protein
VRSTTRFASVGELRDDLGARYTAAILYEFDVLEQHLASVDRDAIVIAFGDHQPPFVAAQTQSFDTPVHVLARDPKLLEELREHGFRDGLRLEAGAAIATTHEALYSLLVRTLARCCAQVNALPAYREGIALDSD